MDRLNEPPIRTPLNDPATNGAGNAAKEWYYYWGQLGARVNTLVDDVDALKNNPGGGSGGQPGDATGPVTGFTTAHEVGTRYADEKDRLVHLTVGFTPTVPTPQPVTYLISDDNGATWVWIGSQRMQTAGQELKVDRLAPGTAGTWKVAAVAGALGGDPTPIPDSQLEGLYPGVERSAGFAVAGLAKPPAAQGITATIGSCTNVITADGFTQYGKIAGVVYTDPVGSLDWFVRITVQNLDASHNPITPEQEHGGTQITGDGDTHTENDLLITYIPGLAFMRYRFYVANRNSLEADPADTADTTLQLVSYNGAPAADHYDVPITIPPFVPPAGGDVFNVSSVTASEVGPKYQDERQGLHTSIGVIPVIDVDYSTPRTVTIWFDFGDGQKVWQGWYSLTAAGQVIRIGDSTLGTDGVRKSGDIWVPANATQGNWRVWCAGGKIDKGIDPTSYASFAFTVVPVGPCSPTGTSDAHFVNDPATGNAIVYSKYDPGIWKWEYYQLTWTPPTLAAEPDYWFTLVTVQKGATIGGVWTPAPDAEGRNDDPTGHYLGRNHAEVVQVAGLSPTQVAVMSKYGAHPATWDIPPLQNADLSPNIYREFRFLLYNVSRLGTDASGSGGAGTYTLQTACWPGGTDHFILIPDAPTGALDIRAANPATITGPLTGGNGLPLTVTAKGITDPYLGDAAVTARAMAANSVTAANSALAANSVVDANITSLTIAKVTYGTSIFAGDVIMSRGPSKPVIVLNNAGITLFGQADASTGAAGLLSKPYAQVQSNAIKLYNGIGGSMVLDGATNSFTIYSADGNTTLPYFTVNTSGLVLYNGPNTVAIGSNAISISDGTNHNEMDLNSAGLTLWNTVSNNRVVITSSAIQLQLGGSPRVTIDNTSGITLSNGGTSSVQITASTVSIINGTLTLNLNGVTTTINNSAIPGGAAYAGLKVKDNSLQYCSFINAGNIRLSSDDTTTPAETASYSFNAIQISGPPTWVAITKTQFIFQQLRSTNPGAGAKEFWYDPADSNRVKFAA